MKRNSETSETQLLEQIVVLVDENDHLKNIEEDQQIMKSMKDKNSRIEESLEKGR